MILTNEIVAGYIGGQVEIIGDGIGDGDRYRGKIKSIEVIPDPTGFGGGQPAILHVEFEYICKWQYGAGFKPHENKPYDVSLCISSVNSIGHGPGIESGSPRLAISAPVVNEMTVIYPPTHNKRVLADGTVESDGD